MGCGRSSLNSNTSVTVQTAAERQAAAKILQDAKDAQAKIDADAAVARAAALAQADSSYTRAVNNRNIVISSLPPIPPPPPTTPLETLVFNVSRPEIPITIYYRNQPTPSDPVTTASLNIKLYSMPDDLLIRNNTVLFIYNASLNDYTVIKSNCMFDLYESDIDPTNLDIYLLVTQGKARIVPLQQRILGPVDTFYNITLNFGKYYQVIISSSYSPAHPVSREIIYYKSSVKQYMGVDGFTNMNLYTIEGYTENHPLLPKNYYPFSL